MNAMIARHAINVVAIHAVHQRSSIAHHAINAINHGRSHGSPRRDEHRNDPRWGAADARIDNVIRSIGASAAPPTTTINDHG